MSLIVNVHEIVVLLKQDYALQNWRIMYWVGMLNDNRKIDYRNGLSFSCLYYRFSKWVRVHWRQQAPSGCLPRCYLSLNPHLSWHFTVGHLALRAVAWLLTGLPSMPTGKSVWLYIVCCTGQRAPPAPYRRRVTALSKRRRCSDVHVASSMLCDWSSVVTDETGSGWTV